MQRLADYKVIKDSVTQIGSNQSHTIDFTLSGAIVQAQGGQRPYLLLSENIGGALPGTISITLNGNEIDSRDGSASDPLSGGLSYTHMVTFDGALLNVGSNNSLTIEVSTSTNTSLDLGVVILHFQREI